MLPTHPAHVPKTSTATIVADNHIAVTAGASLTHERDGSNAEMSHGGGADAEATLPIADCR